MMHVRFAALAATVVLALAAGGARAQDSPSRAVGGTIGVGASGLSATVFGEADRGHWRGLGRISAIGYAIGCKGVLGDPCPDDTSALVATLGGSLLSSSVPKLVRMFVGGAVGIARYNTGLGAHADYWVGSDVGGHFTQLRVQIGGEYSHHPMPFLELGVRRAF